MARGGWRVAGGGRSFWLAVGLMLLTAVGCQSAAVGPAQTGPLAAESASSDAHSATTAATRHSPPPTRHPSASEDADAAIAALPCSPAPLLPCPPVSPPEATAAAPPTPTPQATTVPATRHSPPATATPTPFPTFTPPPPPPPVAGEHLYWQRPVPATGPTWTDKSYPYGSTRGGMLRPHHGVEFVVPVGTPVLAVAAGTVRVAGDDSQTAYGPQANFYGNLVVMEVDGTSGTPVFALYGHLSEVAVSVGQVVVAGETLGLSGSSGVADGPHLHLEVRVGENSYENTRNPLLWLAPLPGTGVVTGRIVGAGGELLHEAPVALQRVDGPAPYTATVSYAAAGPRADGDLGENFVMDDVEPGFYEVVVDTGNRRHTAEVWVYAGRVNWVEVVVP